MSQNKKNGNGKLSGFGAISVDGCMFGPLYRREHRSDCPFSIPVKGTSEKDCPPSLSHAYQSHSILLPIPGAAPYSESNSGFQTGRQCPLRSQESQLRLDADVNVPWVLQMTTGTRPMVDLPVPLPWPSRRWRRRSIVSWSSSSGVPRKPWRRGPSPGPGALI